MCGVCVCESPPGRSTVSVLCCVCVCDERVCVFVCVLCVIQCSACVQCVRAVCVWCVRDPWSTISSPQLYSVGNKPTIHCMRQNYTFYFYAKNH